MVVTLKNYEQYALGYIEGTLDKHTREAFDLFLQQHPGIKAELEDVAEMTIVPSNTAAFERKEELKRCALDDEEAFSNRCIAFHEGELSAEQQEEFEGYLQQHPDRKKGFQLFAHTILKADPSVCFPEKNRLYKKPRLVALRIAASIAAAIILAFPAINQLINIPEKNGILSDNTFTDSLKKEVVNPVMATVTEEKTTPLTISSTGTRPLAVAKAKTATVSPQQPTTDNTLAIQREELPLPASLSPLESQKLTVSLNTIPVEVRPQNVIPHQEERSDNFWIAKAEKAKKGKIFPSFKDITRTGLKIITNASGKALKFDTGQSGDVQQISMDSKLIAFNIPVTKKEKPVTK